MLTGGPRHWSCKTGRWSPWNPSTPEWPSFWSLFKDGDDISWFGFLSWLSFILALFFVTLCFDELFEIRTAADQTVWRKKTEIENKCKQTKLKRFKLFKNSNFKQLNLNWLRFNYCVPLIIVRKCFKNLWFMHRRQRLEREPTESCQ